MISYLLTGQVEFTKLHVQYKYTFSEPMYSVCIRTYVPMHTDYVYIAILWLSLYYVSWSVVRYQVHVVWRTATLTFDVWWHIRCRVSCCNLIIPHLLLLFPKLRSWLSWWLWLHHVLIYRIVFLNAKCMICVLPISSIMPSLVCHYDWYQQCFCC